MFRNSRKKIPDIGGKSLAKDMLEVLAIMVKYFEVLGCFDVLGVSTGTSNCVRKTI